MWTKFDGNNNMKIAIKSTKKIISILTIFFSTLAMVYLPFSYAADVDGKEEKTKIIKLIKDPELSPIQEISTGIIDLEDGRYQVEVSIRKNSYSVPIQIDDCRNVILMNKDKRQELVVDKSTIEYSRDCPYGKMYFEGFCTVTMVAEDRGSEIQFNDGDDYSYDKYQVNMDYHFVGKGDTKGKLLFTGEFPELEASFADGVVTITNISSKNLTIDEIRSTSGYFALVKKDTEGNLIKDKTQMLKNGDSRSFDLNQSHLPCDIMGNCGDNIILAYTIDGVEKEVDIGGSGDKELYCVKQPPNLILVGIGALIPIVYQLTSRVCSWCCRGCRSSDSKKNEIIEIEEKKDVGDGKDGKDKPDGKKNSFLYLFDDKGGAFYFLFRDGSERLISKEDMEKLKDEIVNKVVDRSGTSGDLVRVDGRRASHRRVGSDRIHTSEFNEAEMEVLRDLIFEEEAKDKNENEDEDVGKKKKDPPTLPDKSKRKNRVRRHSVGTLDDAKNSRVRRMREKIEEVMNKKERIEKKKREEKGFVPQRTYSNDEYYYKGHMHDIVKKLKDGGGDGHDNDNEDGSKEE